MDSGKTTELFTSLQETSNIGIAERKRWKLVLDGGIRWNSLYMMIRRALELKEAINTYSGQLRISRDQLDQDVGQDYLQDEDWLTLQYVKAHLEPLFFITKGLEGNADLEESAGKASHSALWETLPVFDVILSHSKYLQDRAEAGGFAGDPRIQTSITLAWNKANEYYTRTDLSIAWTAGLVLYPRWKWAYFEEKWTGPERVYLDRAKTKLRALWEAKYKGEVQQISRESIPEQPAVLYLGGLLNNLAPVNATAVPRPNGRRDQFALYLKEPPTAQIGLMDYWRSRERVAAACIYSL